MRPPAIIPGSRAGMALAPRHRQSRPMPMSAVAVRRGRFGEFELRPVRERTVHAVPAEEPEEAEAPTAER
jgi:hypothetical protein